MASFNKFSFTAGSSGNKSSTNDKLSSQRSGLFSGGSKLFGAVKTAAQQAANSTNDSRSQINNGDADDVNAQRSRSSSPLAQQRQRTNVFAQRAVPSKYSWRAKTSANNDSGPVVEENAPLKGVKSRLTKPPYRGNATGLPPDPSALHRLHNSLVRRAKARKSLQGDNKMQKSLLTGTAKEADATTVDESAITSSFASKGQMTKAPPMPPPPVPLRRQMTRNRAFQGLTQEQANILKQVFDLRGRHCLSEFDKYQLLDERDKLLYKWRELREAEIVEESAGGGCSSLCPEKERYVRVVQKRISIYECDSSGRMEPHRMIKEYARSAADQEKPLPHEFRIPEALQQSLNYLLKYIADSIPSEKEELAGWYDFLWNRTRAIRKEVTQLMLVDERAVRLIESCVRLHIVAAYLLCSLEPEHFDQKMNTENLGKSLQTLRHMYEDLAKRGIHCETEPEFRAYDVMLYLHDSNVLRQILSYRKEVRESAPVRLAIQLTTAMQNKNYVKFFRLLRHQGTFLQCCICHRFFNQLRGDALCVIALSYRYSTVFGVERLAAILGYDGTADGLKALTDFGVTLDDENQPVINQHSLVNASNIPMCNYQWIDTKRITALSSVISGQSTVEFHAMFVVDSFDNHYYTKDPVVEELVEKYATEVERKSSESQAAQQQEELIASRKRQEMERAQALEEERRRKEEGKARQRALAMQTRQKSMQDISWNLIDEFVRRIVEETFAVEKAVAYELAEKQRREQEKIRRKLQAREACTASTSYLVESVLNQVIGRELRKTCKEQLKLEFGDHVKSITSTIANKAYKKSFEPAIDKMIYHAVSIALKEETARVDEGLSAFRQRMHGLWIRQFFDAWRRNAANKRNTREIRENNLLELKAHAVDKSAFWHSCYLKTDKESPESAAIATTSADFGLQSYPERVRLARLRAHRADRLAREAFDHWRNVAATKAHNRKINQKLMRYFPQLLAQKENRRASSSAIVGLPPQKKQRKTSFSNGIRDSDSFIVFGSPLNSIRVPHRAPVNSTALSWHTDVSLRFSDSLYNSTILPPTPSETLIMENSVLSDSDLEWAREQMERTGCHRATPKTEERKRKLDEPEKTIVMIDVEVPETLRKGIEDHCSGMERMLSETRALKKRMEMSRRESQRLLENRRKTQMLAELGI